MKSACEPHEANRPQVAQQCRLLNLSLHPKIRMRCTVVITAAQVWFTGDNPNT